MLVCRRLEVAPFFPLVGVGCQKNEMGALWILVVEKDRVVPLALRLAPVGV